VSPGRTETKRTRGEREGQRLTSDTHGSSAVGASVMSFGSQCGEMEANEGTRAKQKNENQALKGI
jgi:hypothetical protein